MAGIVAPIPASLLAHLEDAKTNAATKELDKVGQALAKIPILDGHLHTVTLTASTTTVLNHKLGREPRGWIVCGITGGSPAFYESASNKRQLTFTNVSGSDLTVRLWVF